MGCTPLFQTEGANQFLLYWLLISQQFQLPSSEYFFLLVEVLLLTLISGVSIGAMMASRVCMPNLHTIRSGLTSIIPQFEISFSIVITLGLNFELKVYHVSLLNKGCLLFGDFQESGFVSFVLEITLIGKSSIQWDRTDRRTITEKQANVHDKLGFQRVAKQLTSISRFNCPKGGTNILIFYEGIFFVNHYIVLSKVKLHRYLCTNSSKRKTNNTICFTHTHTQSPPLSLSLEWNLNILSKQPHSSHHPSLSTLHPWISSVKNFFPFP